MPQTTARPPSTAGVAGAPSPDDPRLRAWIAFLQAHAVVTRLLEAELHAERGLSLAAYDALVQLAIADDRRLRMSELANRVVLSRSGVSRLVDRLAANGLVARRACPTDARGSWAELTPAGLDRLRDAAPVHLRGVDAHFLSPIAAEDREGLVRALEAVVRGLQSPDEPAPPACGTIAEAQEP
ncbi:MAG: MarR family transcriptional regulator [Chloroflexota bacterium]